MTIHATASGTVVGHVCTITLTGVQAGDALICYPSWGQGSNLNHPTISDSLNGSWTGPVTQGTDVSNQVTEQWLFPNSKAGTATITITFDAAQSFLCADAAAVNNVVASPLQTGHTFNAQTGVSGTNSVTSTAVTPTATSALVVGFSADNNTNTAPNAGTGYASSGSTFGFGGTSATMESKLITTTASVAATFTPNNTNGDFCTLILILTQQLSAELFFGSGTTQ